jgi:hypothetical protein
VALLLQDAGQLFDIIIMFGAGTGLVFLLRWFVPRINAWGEIAAMVASGVIAMIFTFMSWDDIATTEHVETLGESLGYWQKPLAVGLTTLIWVFAVLVTPPVDPERLASFQARIRPLSTPFGWALLATVMGCLTVYAALFATGWWIYGQTTAAAVASAIMLATGMGLGLILPKVLGHEGDGDAG